MDTSITNLRTVASFGNRLCVCVGGEHPDGAWPANLMYEPGAPAEAGSRSATRRQTIQLLARMVATHPVRYFTRDIGHVLAFGDFLTTDPVTSGIDVAGA
ncbi:hypothetical protein AB0P17_01010 [Streptomyces sp. NPDC088124]|uniref:hypothetical protein n=1 Tax=Streptomyces sp. NPDC088124 TaxID=3154654 RepID=UPI00342D1928